jgi:uncharacterized membrane protein
VRLKGDTVGAFIDAVYAIAVTILALEIPGALPAGGFGLTEFLRVLLEYGVAFVLLFSFWLQHRRINGLVAEVDRTGLWTNAITLLLVCLVPRATTLVFAYGSDVTVHALESSFLGKAAWTTAEIVDVFYVIVVVMIDVLILSLLHLNRGRSGSGETGQLRRTKVAASVLLFVVVGTSFLLPVENRYFLLAIPVLLFFEDEMSRLIDHFAGRFSSGPQEEARGD